MSRAPKKAIIGALITGVCTFILCIPFYVLLVKGEMPLTSVFGDIAPSLFITPFICGLVQIPLKKKSTMSGKETILPDAADQASYLFMPKNNKVAFCAASALVSMAIFSLAPIGLMYVVNPVMVFGRWPYIIYKCVCSGLAVTLAIYHVNIMLPYITKQQAVAAGTWQFD